MAAAMWKIGLRSTNLCRACFSAVIKRHLLSDAYRCENAWQKRLASPVLQEVNFSEFIVEMHENFEKRGQSSLIDMEILANKLTAMDSSELDMVEKLIYRFRHSPDAVPVRDSIMYAIVRSFIDLNLTDSLLEMLKNKHGYGIFPDSFSCNILLDHFIKANNYKDAAAVAYEEMLQEDFSHPLTFLLSLYACTKHLYHPVAQEVVQVVEEDVPKPDSEEEIWIPIKIVPQPFYDDHFEIVKEQFLLGKTLYMLGRQMDSVMGRSLQFVGMGLYDKFPRGLQLLEDWIESDSNPVVLEEVVLRFGELLKAAETRDPDAEVKDLGIRTIEDEIELFKLTPDKKDACLEKFKVLSAQLTENGRTSPEKLESLVEEYVKQDLSQHEAKDIESQQALLSQWEQERTEMLETQIRQYQQKQKESEIQRKLRELQEKEELLRFFENENEIALAQLKVKQKKTVKSKTKDDDDDDWENYKRGKQIIRK